MAGASIRSSRRRAAAAGFAYLWVLLLVALMGLGLSVGLEVHATAVQRDKERELLAIGRQFRQAIARYHATRAGGPSGAQGDYPASLDDLLKDNRMPGVTRHLRKVFVDPMTGKAEWGLVRIGGRIVGVHSLSERMPIKQDHFEAEDMGFRAKEKYSDWVFAHPSNLLLQAAPGAAGASAPASSSASAPARPGPP